MEITPTALSGVLILTPARFGDHRGYFSESWNSEELSATNGRQLLVPKGFLHGFLTLTENVLVAYKCSDFYSRECDGAVRFDDPDLGIDWGIGAGTATVSEKDGSAQAFADFQSPFAYEETAS